MEAYNVLKAFSTSPSIALGVMFECAMDNAGLNGYHVEDLFGDEVHEVVYHLTRIVDGRTMQAWVVEADYAQARGILGIK